MSTLLRGIRRTIFYAAHPSRARQRIRDVFRPRNFTVRQVKAEGLTLLVMAHEDVGWRLMTGRMENDEIAVLRTYVRDDDFCIDVGANIGLYCMLMSRLAPNGRVMAIEPSSLNRAFVSINAALNGGAENLVVLDGVLSDRPGEVEFSVATDGGYSSMRSTGRCGESKRLTMPARTLDDISSGRKVNVLKVDVEGAELMVLRGGSDLLASKSRRPRFMLVELSAANQAAYGTGPAETADFLRSFGYVPNSVTPAGLVAEWPHPDAGEDVVFLDPNQT